MQLLVVIVYLAPIIPAALLGPPTRLTARPSSRSAGWQANEAHHERGANIDRAADPRARSKKELDIAFLSARPGRAPSRLSWLAEPSELQTNRYTVNRPPSSL